MNERAVNITGKDYRKEPQRTRNLAGGVVMVWIRQQRVRTISTRFLELKYVGYKAKAVATPLKTAMEKVIYPQGTVQFQIMQEGKQLKKGLMIQRSFLTTEEEV